MTEFGQAGHAGDYAPLPIADMIAGYRDGSARYAPHWLPSSLPPQHFRNRRPLRIIEAPFRF